MRKQVKITGINVKNDGVGVFSLNTYAVIKIKINDEKKIEFWNFKKDLLTVIFL